jgi:hypothetical protein
MRSLFTLVLLLAALQQSYAQNKNLKHSRTKLSFVANAGQITNQNYVPRTDIDFRIAGAGINVFIGKGSLHYQWAKPIGTKVVGQDSLQEIATYRMDVQLLGANPNAILVKEQPTAYYERYYTPQFGAEGGIAQSYARITYKNIYPHIDWTLYVKNNQVEYDFVVHPGGKVSDIQLQYAGASALAINDDGSLSVQTPFGSVTEAAPYSFQEDGKSVASTFTRHNNILSFEVEHYEGTLVIDPVLEWGTYYGGSFNEEIPVGCIAADAFGNAYFTGHTTSTQNIATTGSFLDTISGSSDLFLVKFSPTGQRMWATYYGGYGIDQSAAVTCDKNTSVYIAGKTGSIQTYSPHMSTSSSHQPIIGGGYDALLVKFDSSGARQWATYYGGPSSDEAFGLACDTADNIIMSGLTASTTGIATTGAYQEARSGGNDAFIVKFNPQGQRLWGTYFGGTNAEYTPGIATDNNNNILLTGATQSTNNIASLNAYQSTIFSTRDAFISKFDSLGNIQWSTYLGDLGTERVSSVACDSNRNIYIYGDVNDVSAVAQIISPGSAQPIMRGTSDAFLVKLDATGNRVWGTFVGGNGNEIATQITYSEEGFLYLVGTTNSADSFATPDAFQTTQNGIQNAYIGKFDLEGQKIWLSYFGGATQENGLGIAISQNSTLFIAGISKSPVGVATANAHQTAHGGSSNDGYIALINDCDLYNNNSILGADSICQGVSYTYTTNTVPGAQSYQWMVPSGWQGASTTNSIDIVAHGADDSLGLAINFACGTTDTIYFPISVIALPSINPSSTIHSCAGDSILLTAGNADNYQWLQDGQVIPNAGQAALMVSTDGDYQIVSTNSLGCSDTSLATNVHFHALPTPVITANGNVLSTGPYASYQWQHNGNDITGATQQDYTFSINTGAYTVRVVDSNGCSGISAPFTAGVGIAPTANKNTIIVFPNPTQDYLYIQANQPLQLRLSTVDGRTVSNSAHTTIDMRSLAQGVYILYAYDNKGKLLSVHKVIKTASQ